ncbi:radixin-like [Durio zibethinus]|uniref:Radixin-like n=1 Tax=Durio zibethinus TaxID=66656 RepID=A0A6P6B000_DURZI|nr:radixin-like [Durio zibethinus]
MDCMAMTEAQQQPPPPAAVQLTELVFLLEQANQMAKQLPATSDPTYLFQIYSSLHQAHHSLSSFLSATQTQFHVPPPPPPPQPPLPPVAAENSLSSATGAANEDGSEPMQVGDENEAEAEENSKTSIDKVEEKMRECFIKNKRAKRQLSPSSAVVAEERRICEDRFVGGIMGFDPLGEKLRALDLVYQFHG